MSVAFQAAAPASLQLQPRPSFRYSQGHRISVLGFSKKGISFARRIEFTKLNLKKRAIITQSTSRSDLNDSAYRMVEEARKKASEAAEFVKSAFDQRNVRRSILRANEWMADMAFETRSAASRFNRKYRLSEKVDDGFHFVKDQAMKFDREFGVTQKTRTFSMDFRRNWPKYKRDLDDFMKTPLGRAVSTMIFLWLALSGWLIRIIIIGTCVLPFAAPLLIGAIARKTMIEGVCPACKTPFIGNRNEMIMCMQCRAVVWQPREDFSKGNSEPEIIDVDFEEK